MDIYVGTKVAVLDFPLVVTLEWTHTFGTRLFHKLYDADVAHEILANAAHPWIMGQLLAQLTREVVYCKI